MFVRTAGDFSTQQVIPLPTDSRYVSIALSGDIALVGAVSSDSTGKVFVYERASTTWSLQQTLVPDPDPDVSTSSDFGGTIALDGDTAIIGGAGGPHVFRRGAAGFTEQQILSAPGLDYLNGEYPDPSGEVPDFIRLSGDHALIGFRSNGFYGVIEFDRRAGSFSPGRKATAPDGYRVLAALGDLALLGRPGPTEGRLVSAPTGDEHQPSPSDSLGAALVARRSGDAWEPLTELPTRHVNFGYAGALWGFGAVVGSLYDDITEGFRVEGPYWSLVGPGWLTTFELEVTPGSCDVDAHCESGRCVEHVCVPQVEPEPGAGGDAGATNAAGDASCDCTGGAPERQPGAGGTNSEGGSTRHGAAEAGEPASAGQSSQAHAGEPPTKRRAGGGGCTTSAPTPGATSGRASLLAVVGLLLALRRPRGRRRSAA